MGQQIVADRQHHRDRRQHRVGPVRKTVLKIIRRRDESLALGQAMQLGRKHQIDDDDRRHEMHTHQPSVAYSESLTGKCKKRVTAVLCRVQGKHQHHETDPRAGEVKILERVLLAGTHPPVADADQRKQVQRDEPQLRRAKGNFVHEPPSSFSPSLGQVRNAAQAVRHEIKNETPMLTTAHSGMPSTGLEPPSPQYHGTATKNSSR